MIGAKSCWTNPPMLVRDVQNENFVLEHIAAAPINPTGHQLVTLCRLFCAEEGAQILEPSMSSKYCPGILRIFACSSFI